MLRCKCKDPIIVPLDIPVCGKYACTQQYIVDNEIALKLPAGDFIKQLNEYQEEKIHPIQALLDIHAKVPLVQGDKNDYYTEYRVDGYTPHNDGESTTYLFHGSSLTNWYSIVRNGLKNYSNTPAMKNGAAYGSGIYLSSNLNLSYMYSYGGAVKLHQTYIVGVYEIQYEDDYKKAPDIYVVPEGVIKLAYLILVHNGRELDKVGEMLKKQYRTNYKQLRDNYQYFTRVGLTRIAREMKQVAEFCGEVTANDGNHEYTVIYGEYLFVVTFPKSYPLHPPTIRVLNGTNPRTGKDEYVCLPVYPYDIQTRVHGLLNMAVVALSEPGPSHLIPHSELDKTQQLIQYI